MWCVDAIHGAIQPLGGRLLPFGWLKFLLGLKKIRTLRVVTLGLKKDYRMRGIQSLMFERGLRAALKRGFTGCEVSWSRSRGATPSATGLLRRARHEALPTLAAGAAPARRELLEAWNRRLSRAPEKRPIGDLDVTLDAIGSAFSLAASPEVIEALLRFLASWPSQRPVYLKALQECLRSGRFTRPS